MIILAAAVIIISIGNSSGSDKPNIIKRRMRRLRRLRHITDFRYVFLLCYFFYHLNERPRVVKKMTSLFYSIIIYKYQFM